MKYYILDNNLDVIELIELYSSSIWTRRFWDVGDFELYLPANSNTVPLFAEAITNGYYIVGENDLKHAMIPFKLEIESKKDSGSYISVKGYDLKYLLNRRIVWDYRILGGELETSLRNLVKKNAIDPIDKDRIIPKLYLDDESNLVGAHDIISASLFGENLAVGIKSLCKLYGYGWDIELDLEHKKMIFKILKGLDLRDSVIFSDEMENLYSTKYSLDMTQPKNIAYVEAKLISQDQETLKEEIIDLSQTVTLNGSIPTGLGRFELYVDNNESYDNRYSLSQYNYILRENAKRELRNAKVRDSISGEVVPNYTYELGRDYNIGDLVLVKNEYGQQFSSRIVEVITSIATDKDTTVPSFEIYEESNMPTPIDPNDVRITKKEGQAPGPDDYRVTSDGELRVLSKTYRTTRSACNIPGELVDRTIMVDGTEVDRDIITLFNPDIYV